MLTVTRRSGASSTADRNRTGAQKGNKGRLELFATDRGNGNYSVSFVDYGNFGKERWAADFGVLTQEQLNDMIESLQALRSGALDTTHALFEQVEAQAGEPTEALAEEVSEEENHINS